MAHPPTLEQWLSERDFWLTLSSGFFGFFAHAGMAAALYESGIRPSGISGSSAGALVGAYLAAGMEPQQLGILLRSLRRSDFWDPAPGPGLLAGRAFRHILESTLPAGRFEDLEIPLAVSAHDLLSWQTVVLNRGPLPEAVHASSAVPLLFHPVRVDGRLLVDGGVSDRPGMAGVPQATAVFAHHIVSRSPWRLRAPQPPHGAELVALAIHGLPRSGPFRLSLGPKIYQMAFDATRLALRAPVAPLVEVRTDIWKVSTFDQVEGDQEDQR